MKIINRKVITNYEVYNVMGDLNKIITERNFPLPLKVQLTELINEDYLNNPITLDISVKDSIGWPIRESLIIDAVCNHLNIKT